MTDPKPAPTQAPCTVCGQMFPLDDITMVTDLAQDEIAGLGPGDVAGFCPNDLAWRKVNLLTKLLAAKLLAEQYAPIWAADQAAQDTKDKAEWDAKQAAKGV